MTFYFYTHTEIPISSKGDEGESLLRQQEDVPSEVKENQAQKNRKLTPSVLINRNWKKRFRAYTNKWMQTIQTFLFLTYNLN